MTKYLTFVCLVYINTNFASIISDSTQSNASNIDESGNSNYYYFDVFNNWTADDYYYLLDSLKKYGTTDFFKLRITYTKTETYEPYDAEFESPFNPINDKIEQENYLEAAHLLDSLLEKEYVNIKAHLYLGYVYRLMNDSVKSKYHYNIYGGLIESILNYGDGSIPEKAFIVIFVEEEYLLLDAVNMSMTTQELVPIDGHSFDLLTVFDNETKEKSELYFNIDLLIDH